jgi:hypothetical protein
MKWEIKNNWKYGKFEKYWYWRYIMGSFLFNKNYFFSVDLHNTSYKGGGEVWASKYTHPHYMSRREREKGQACKHTLSTYEQANKHKYIVRKHLIPGTCPQYPRYTNISKLYETLAYKLV